METENTYKLKKAIVATVAYFDMFDFPLTEDELYNFLYSGEGAVEKEKIKLFLPEIQEIGRNDAFYFLKGRENILNIRKLREKTFARKYRRVKIIAKIFSFIPWIKFIGLGNIMGEKNLREESDLDIFIIAENKKIWLTRFFCNGLMSVLGLRPTKENTRDKICLSFFISEDHLNLKGLLLEEGDIYFSYWLAFLLPIYNKQGTYERLLQANHWLKESLPNWIGGTKVSSSKRRFNLLSLLGGKEEYFKNLQLRILPAALKNKANLNTEVVINDNVLKLHTNDRRLKYREKWRQSL